MKSRILPIIAGSFALVSLIQITNMSLANAREDTANISEQNAQKTMLSQSIEEQLAKIDKIANNDIAHLIAMYETMKPKKAAEIFNNMAPSFAAGFLIDMNSTRAGLIMSEMETQKSYEVSLVIASRNANLRKSKTPA